MSLAARLTSSAKSLLGEKRAPAVVGALLEHLGRIGEIRVDEPLQVGLSSPISPGDAAAVAVALQADGKIVAAGGSGAGGRLDFALARYTANGSLDPSFGTGGTW
jgi:hypothetical protein